MENVMHLAGSCNLSLKKQQCQVILVFSWVHQDSMVLLSHMQFATAAGTNGIEERVANMIQFILFIQLVHILAQLFEAYSLSQRFFYCLTTLISIAMAVYVMSGKVGCPSWIGKTRTRQMVDKGHRDMYIDADHIWQKHGYGNLAHNCISHTDLPRLTEHYTVNALLFLRPISLPRWLLFFCKGTLEHTSQVPRAVSY